MTHNYKAGDTFYITFLPRWYNQYPQEYKVERVTPRGTAVLDGGDIRITKHGKFISRHRQGRVVSFRHRDCAGLKELRLELDELTDALSITGEQ